MSEQTKIAWCDSTVNFWSGCTKVSAGCAHCYAETRDKRHMIEKIDHWGKGAPRLKHTGAIKQARALNRKPWICDGCGRAFANENTPHDAPILADDGKTVVGYHHRYSHLVTYHRRRIFSLSLGDWLDAAVPIVWLAEMLDTLHRCDQVQWILCTKRPQLWRDRMNAVLDMPTHHDAAGVHSVSKQLAGWICDWLEGKAPNQILLLTSVENQGAADERIPALLKIPAAARGLSLEPLLGPVNLSTVNLNPSTLHWLILGGESGPGARVCSLDWLADLIRQGTAAGVPVFVKQLGANPFCENANVYDWPENVELEPAGTAFAACRPLCADPKGGNMNEWPDEFRVQNYPKVTSAPDAPDERPAKTNA